MQKNGDAKEAVGYYKQAIEICPPGHSEEVATYHNNLGMAKRKLGIPLEALEEFCKAIELNPKYTKPLFLRMGVYRELGLHIKALEDA